LNVTSAPTNRGRTSQRGPRPKESKPRLAVAVNICSRTPAAKGKDIAMCKPFETEKRNVKYFLAPLVLALVLGVFGSPAKAEGKGESDITVMVEVDPMPYVFSGYAAHVRLGQKNSPWILTLGSYGLEFPDLLVDFNSKNRDEGWQSEIKNAYAVFGDYHFSGKPEGLFVGTQIAYQGFGLKRDSVDQTQNNSVLLVMPRVDTLWKPFESNFYILPWAGVGANLRLDNKDLTLGNDEFDVALAGAFVTMHMGWQF